MATQESRPDKGDPPALLGSLRVIDITDVQGYDCGKFLATLGADVIRVDSGEPADRTRWTIGNVGKRSMQMDYRGEERSLFLDLVEKCDILIETGLPGELDAIGLGYHDLKKRNPKLIQVSITPFGQQAPYAAYKGGELVVSALASNLWQMGDAGRAPVKEPGLPNFFHACAAGAYGAVLAVWMRDTTGEGQLVDISAQEMGAGRNTLWILQRQFADRCSNRFGQHIDMGWGSKRAVWALADGYAFFQMLPPGAPGTKALVNWIEEATGKACAEDDVETVEQFLATLTVADVIAQSAPRDVRIMPVSGPAEVASDPQLAARGLFVSHDGMKLPGEFVKITTAGEAA